MMNKHGCQYLRTVAVAVVTALAATLRAQVEVEYFIDTDPGMGQAQRFSVSPDADGNVSFSPSTHELQPGQHTLGWRTFRMSEGKRLYGPTLTHNFIVPRQSDTFKVTYVEYFFDSDPGIGQGMPIVVASPGSEVNTSDVEISTAGLAPGIHQIGLRAFGDSGWGPTVIQDINVPMKEADLSMLSAEYFVDTDPGFGQGTPISITAGQEVTVDGLGLSTTGLSQGRHLLGVRYRGTNGWSTTLLSDFYNIEGDGSSVTNAEYFWDTDPGFGQGTPIALTPGEEVTLEDLGIPSYEIHGDAILYIRYRGPQGWSPTLGFAIVVEAEGSYTLNAAAATDAATRTYQTLGDALSEFADRGVGADITLNVTTTDTNYALDATGEEVLAQFAALGTSLGTVTSPRAEKAITFTAAEGSGNTLSITTTAEGLPTVVDALAHTSTENVALTINGTAYDFRAAARRHEEIFCNETTTALALSSISTAITATWTAQPHQGTAIGGYQASGEGDLPAMTLTCTGTKQDSIAYAITLSDAEAQTLCTYTYYIYVRPRVNASDMAALQQLYTDFGGASWSGKKWDTTDNLITASNWSGVTFDGTGRVTAIDLSKRGLTGHTLNAATLAPMTALRSLKLAYNQIDEINGLLPTTITTLDLSYQHRKSGSSSTMLGLESLTTQAVSVGQNTGITLPSAISYNHTGRNFNEHPTLKVYTTAYSQVGTLTWSAVNETYTFEPSSTQVTLEQDADIVLIAGSGSGANSAMPATLHFMAGDANLSGLVDVNDVQRTLNYVLNTSNGSAFGLWSANTYTMYETEPVINIQDIVCTVDIVLEEEGNAVKAYKSHRANKVDEADEANTFFAENNCVYLNAADGVAAFDLQLSGVSASQVKLLLNGSHWQMVARNTPDGVRLIVFSPTGDVLPIGTTPLLRLGAEATLCGVQATSPEAEELPAGVSDNGPTGIIVPADDDQPQTAYDLAGRKVPVRRTGKGIYIVGGKKVAK